MGRAGESPDWQRLYDRREDYKLAVVPNGGLFLTAGIDIQKDRIEAEVVAWGRGKESWSVDYLVYEGPTAEAVVWQKLTTLLTLTCATESGASLQIVRFAIDSGYARPEVYDWTRKHGGSRAVVIKGDSRASAPVSHPSPIDVGPRGNRLRFGIKVWPVNTGMIKEELYRWLRLDRPTEESGAAFPPGYCHFPKYGEEYFKQLTAEQSVTRVVKGYRKPGWGKRRVIATRPWMFVCTRARQPLSTGWITSRKTPGRPLRSSTSRSRTSPRRDSIPADPQPPRGRRVRYRFGSDWLGGRGDNWFDHRGNCWD